MATISKKVEDIQVGDEIKISKRVNGKFEDGSKFVIHFDDGTTMEFEKLSDPALEVESK